MKDKGRRYGDEKRSATFCDICVGDKVLLKQVKYDKGSTTFAKDPFVVISRNGNSVVIENEKGRFKRNITHVKKFNYVEVMTTLQIKVILLVSQMMVYPRFEKSVKRKCLNDLLIMCEILLMLYER